MQRRDDSACIENRSVLELCSVLQANWLVSLSFVIANEMAIQWMAEQLPQGSPGLRTSQCHFRTVVSKESELCGFGAGRSRLRVTRLQGVKHVSLGKIYLFI